MSTRRNIPDNWISSNPESDAVVNVRPTAADSWTTPKDSNSAVSVRLVAFGEEPVAVGEVVIHSNADEVEVFYKPSDKPEVEFLPIKTDEENKPEVCSHCLEVFENKQLLIFVSNENIINRDIIYSPV